jgi:hypothetical protein
MSGPYFVRVGHEELARLAGAKGFSRVHFLVFLTIRKYHNKKVGYAWPGVPLLEQEVNASRTSVKRAIRDLKEGGFIRVIYRMGLGNQYHVMHCECAECVKLERETLERELLAVSSGPVLLQGGRK